MSTQADLQKQIFEAESKISELRKKLEEQLQGERAQAIASAKDLIGMHNLTASELGLAGRVNAGKKPKTDKRVTVAPKYRDPTSGKTWTGRGKTPSWMVAELAAGKTKNDFTI